MSFPDRQQRCGPDQFFHFPHRQGSKRELDYPHSELTPHLFPYLSPIPPLKNEGAPDKQRMCRIAGSSVTFWTQISISGRSVIRLAPDETVESRCVEGVFGDLWRVSRKAEQIGTQDRDQNSSVSPTKRIQGIKIVIVVVIIIALKTPQATRRKPTP